MKSENILESLHKIRQLVDAIQRDMTSDSQKMRVALSNIMRLLNREKGTITDLGGTPDDLLKYLLTLSNEHENKIVITIDSVTKDLDELIIAVNRDVRNG